MEAVVRREVLEKEASIQAAALSSAQSENSKLQTRLAEAESTCTSLASALRSLREREAAYLKTVGEEVSAQERLSEAERALGKAQNEAILLRGASSQLSAENRSLRLKVDEAGRELESYRGREATDCLEQLNSGSQVALLKAKVEQLQRELEEVQGAAEAKKKRPQRRGVSYKD